MQSCPIRFNGDLKYFGYLRNKLRIVEKIDKKLDDICLKVTEHEIKIEKLEKDNEKIHGKFRVVFTSIFGSGGLIGIILTVLKLIGVL